MKHTPEPWTDEWVSACCNACAGINPEAVPLMVEALELTLEVAMRFEKQASRGAGGRRGGPVFAKARAALQKAREGQS